jgi:Icc-related predicted phosphoesterase
MRHAASRHLIFEISLTQMNSMKNYCIILMIFALVWSEFAVAQRTETEPNDNSQQANVMVLGSETDTLRASFSSPTDVDWFAFDLDANKMYYIGSFNSLADPNAQLFHESDLTRNVLTGNIDNRNDSQDFRIAGYVPARSGRYYLKVFSMGGTSGPYSVRITGGRSVTQISALHEDDNTPARATSRPALVSGVAVTSAIYPTNDIDYYKIFAAGGQTYLITTAPLPDMGFRDCDTYMELVDSVGRNVFAFSDDIGKVAGVDGENTFSTFSGAFPATGTYYVRVRGTYNSDFVREPLNDANPPTGEYLLKAEIATPPLIRVGPYLQNVTRNSITIMWETEYPISGRVDYGLAPSYGTSIEVGEPLTFHEIPIESLQEETTYYYKITSGDTSVVGGTFKTAPKPGTPFRIAVYGDNRIDPRLGGFYHRQVAEGILSKKPDIVVNTGDVVTTGTEYFQWKRDFFEPAQNLVKSVPVFVAIGNHEGDAEWFYRYFSFPGFEDYYSFDYSNVHFIMMDFNYGWSTTSPDYRPGSEQYQWLVNELQSPATKNARWVILAGHQPPYSNYWDSPGYTGEAGLREHIVPLVEPAKVDLWLAGHTHDYERGYRNGVTYIISGGGGSLIDKVKTMEWSHVSQQASTYHYCIFDVANDSISCKVYDLDNNVIDSFVLRKPSTGVESRDHVALPSAFQLHQNYPNPFNPSSYIEYDLPIASEVTLIVHDMLGRVLRTLDVGFREAGKHQVIWDGRDNRGHLVASGVYFYSIATTSGWKQTKRMMLVR